jgi:prolyl-tRNA synthetase
LSEAFVYARKIPLLKKTRRVRILKIMKISQTFIPTLREVPADAVIASHRLMFRAGMLRKLANGLFAYLPLGLRAFRKVENIIREEMDAIGALEIKPSVVVPAELWKESGRWETMGDSMLRVKNRAGAEFVVSPTAEEAVTALVRDELSSYKQLPLTVYQINTKFRDEIRPRYGVMRAREFTMKDAYSFHTDEKSLDETYQKMGAAYRKIFKRCGLSVIAVKADSGAMGGSGSEEFMVESEIGDNTLILCKACGYAANVEKASCKPDSFIKEDTQKKESENANIKEKKTPSVKTIAELCAFFKTDAKSFIKTLIYRAENVEIDGVQSAEAFFAVCIRGDLDVNETKLAALLKAGGVSLANDADVERLTGAPVGFAGPVGLKNLPIIADESVPAIENAITGALERDLHFCNVVYGRDWSPRLVADLRTVKAGDRCSVCGGELYEKKGNELGHIFKLGYKYTKTMNARYLDGNGAAQIPLMGCYGIGVDRVLASIIEERHDEDGVMWTMSTAPYHIIIVPVKYDGEVRRVTDELEKRFAEKGVEVLVDDRGERPGVKFKDADLIGVPFRVVVGDKNLALAPSSVEVKRRNGKETQILPIDQAVEAITNAVFEELRESAK